MIILPHMEKELCRIAVANKSASIDGYAISFRITAYCEIGSDDDSSVDKSENEA